MDMISKEIMNVYLEYWWRTKLFLIISAQEKIRKTLEWIYCRIKLLFISIRTPSYISSTFGLKTQPRIRTTHATNSSVPLSSETMTWWSTYSQTLRYWMGLCLSEEPSLLITKLYQTRTG